ncbi:MAG: hypothetical protein E6I93_01210 [Chloroflexi bacterium]|nr:MAG: hypothetical protein E6I93_01210 [Chloroflexota bacterium]
MLTEPGIVQYICSETCACISINLYHAWFWRAGVSIASVAPDFIVEIAAFARTKNGGWAIDEHLHEYQ